MKCAVHTDVDATAYCRQCGKPLCPQCARDVRGALYCEDCLSQLVFASTGPRPALRPGANRPGVAAVFGLVPGLGAVYNGEYIKALIHVCIFGGLIAALSSDMPGSFQPLFSIALACFYFYMPMDAYRTAKARETGEPVPELVPLQHVEGRLPLGPVLLIGLGVLLLFSNFGLFRRNWFGRLWPIGLIALGAWVLFRVRQDS
jgi:hypothetical protein